MSKLKVLIIDDEILAIEHLKQLVHWDELGYEVAGETVHPRKGLEMADKLKPDLIFVDIRMPGMDGLTVGEMLAESGSQAKIVILTSYKEFDYVKRSLRIGVHDYWVKHELTPDSLAQELRQIKHDIIKDKRMRKNMCKPLFELALEGQPLSNDELKTLTTHMKLYGTQYAYIALELDEPYVAAGKAAEREACVPPSWLREEWNGFRLIESFAQGGSRIGVLVGFEGMVSQLQLHEELVQVGMELKQAYQRHVRNGRTVSAAFSSPFREAYGLCKAAESTGRTLQLRIFGDADKIWASSDARAGSLPASEQTHARLEARLGRLSRHADDQRLDKVLEDLDAVFAMVKAGGRLQELRQTCDVLADKLDRIRMDKGRPAFRDEICDEIEGSQAWTSISGISNWFKEQFQAAMGEADAGAAAYSMKVRKAIQYICRHYAEEVGIDQIAEHLDISGDHLRHMFKNETGRTILDYLTEVRMEKAKRYLATGQFKLYEVAERVGYRNSHYFSKVFQRAVGLHPLEYSERKQS